jgi:type I restriction enzyme M protein
MGSFGVASRIGKSNRQVIPICRAQPGFFLAPRIRRDEAPHPMLTGELRSQIDALWNTFWTGGISNPMEVIEQITCLLFTKRLDDLHRLEEAKANRLKKPMERRVFPEGKDARGRSYEDCRWSRFKHFAPAEMFTVVGEHVFPFLRTLGGDGSTYAHHMKDARFTIPKASLLAQVVDLIDKVPMEDRDTKGDLYEYMLGKIASAGQNGQFRTPRHIIQLMVEMTAPQPKDVVCDPACGTAGFLVATGEYLREQHPEILRDTKLKEHFHHLFHGFDFDPTMLRIGSMNMLLHGVENPDIRYRDSLAQDHAGEEEKYTLVLANPPFAGSLDYENCAKDLQQIVKTRKTELLFLALFLRLLRPGGHAAVIVPDGVLFGSSNAHKTLRRILVEDQKLDAVISLPGGVFKPYAGVSTAILLFTKTNSGGTDHVWFYDVDADGLSLDDKRTELLPPEKLGPVPRTALTAADHAKNNLPDLLARWRTLGGTRSCASHASFENQGRAGAHPSEDLLRAAEGGAEYRTGERARPRTAQSFCVPRADLAAQGYDLSLNRYKEVVHAEVAHRPPGEILKSLAALEKEIITGMKELEDMLK